MKDEKNFSRFYTSFVSLCKKHNLSPTAAAKAAGISSGAPTAWKNDGSVPKPAQREKLCSLFGVTDEELLGYGPDPNDPMVRCEKCGFYYNSLDLEDVVEHEKQHDKWCRAAEKFGFCWPVIYREKVKAGARNKIADENLSMEEAAAAQLDVFRALFSRSLEASDYSLAHVDFPTYVSMMLYQEQWKKSIGLPAYKALVEMYGVKPGMPEGTYYNVPSQKEKLIAQGDELDKETIKMLLDKMSAADLAELMADCAEAMRKKGLD